MGGKVISSSTNTYPFRAYIETLLNYSKEAKNTQLGMGLFYKDTAGHFDELDPTSDNTGLNKRHEFGKLSKTMFLQGRVYSEIFNQGRLLLNELPLKVTFQRHKNNFTLLSPAENPVFKVSFQEVVFCLRKVQLCPPKFQPIQQRLKKTPALYPINRVEIKTHSVAQGLSSLNWENAILGQIPNRVFIAMTENSAFTGSYTKNPFLFRHNYLTSIAAHVNVKSIPANPVFLNFENEDFLDGYRSIFTTFGKINRDEGIGIARNEYKDGFSLFGFDLSPALCVGEHQEFKRSGNLTLSLQFGQLPETSTTIILYADYEQSCFCLQK